MTRNLAGILRSLGDTPDSIAAVLESGGWLGLPHDAGSCPVALYLVAMVSGVHGAAVGPEQATVHTTDGSDVEVDLPLAVAEFVRDFDAGAYPDLIVTASDDNGDVIDDLDR